MSTLHNALEGLILLQFASRKPLSILPMQHRPPEDVKVPNKRLQWQIDNRSKGLHFIKLQNVSLSPTSALNVSSSALKLFIFVDSSFANNKDFTSQIGYVIVIATETVKHTESSLRNSVDGKKTITIKGNILHWSSIKCKRVTSNQKRLSIRALRYGTWL